jgi:hypothetical protein
LISGLLRIIQNRETGRKQMSKDMQNDKLAKIMVFLLIISGLFILFFNLIFQFSNISVYSKNIIREYLLGTTSGATLTKLPFFSQFRILKNSLIIYVFALIDLSCAFCLYKGKNIFRWIAFFRSLYTSVNGLICIVSFYVFVGYIGYIYYGAIVTLLILSTGESKE